MLSRRQTLLAGAGLAAASRFRSAAAAPVRTLRMGFIYSTNSQLGAGIAAMAAEVEKRTDGRIRIQPVPDSALGGDVEMLKGIQLGSIDLAFITGVGLASIVPESDVFHIPFLFTNAAHAHAVLDGAVGQEIMQRVAAHDLVPLAWGENGMRHMTNSRHPITVPEDVKGLKIRVPQSEVMMQGLQALGAQVQMLAFPLLFEALQSGQFDGEENPIATIISSRFDKVQKFLTLTAHIYDPAIIVMSPDSFDELSAADRTVFTEAAKLGAAASRRFAAAAEQSGIGTLKQAGMQVVPEIDRARFVAAMAPAMPGYQKRFGNDLIDRIRRIA
jgi:tripartite ATP-independent transporter DctP family solute receptor